MAVLIRFKTSTLTAIGFQRNGVSGEETASQKTEHLPLCSINQAECRFYLAEDGEYCPTFVLMAPTDRDEELHLGMR